jgi:hypothetical protein
MTRQQRIVTALGIGAALSAVAAGGWYFGARSAQMSAPAAAEQSERKVLHWHDPMVPGPKFDKPGKSPFMDMQLVPVYEDEAGAHGTAVITIRPEVMNSLGVRTYKVERAAGARTLKADGYLLRAEMQGGLRVLVDIFDRDVDWVRPGLSAEVQVLGLSDRRWAAAVETVSSDIDVGARSVKATLRLKQPDSALKPNMFANVTISAPSGGRKLVVPREALIRTATRTAVILALGEGRFQPAPVVAGEEYGDSIEIVSGIKEGDVIVTSGQFLIDAEAGLRASFQRMEPPPVDGAPSAKP